MMNFKIIDTIRLWNPHSTKIMGDFEVHGECQEVKQSALDYLEKLDPNATIGILWTRQRFSRSPSNPDIFTGGAIKNIVSACAEDNMMTVKEALSCINER